MHVIVRKSEDRIDPKRPESHPGYDASLKRGLEHFPHMKFESDGAKRDYLKAVASNPNNVPGAPPFYPPMRIVGSVPSEGFRDGRDRFQVMRDEIFYTIWVNCPTCECLHGTTSKTPHVVRVDDSYCQICGTHKDYRICTTTDIRLS